MRTLITGATGLVGRSLIAKLDEPVVLSRDPDRAKRELGRGEAYRWDSAGPPPAEALRGVEVIFNLAGEPVGEGRWTAEKKARIRDSRILGTRHLIAGLRAQETKPKVLISASAIGFYGDRGDDVLDETSTPGPDFLAGICQEWEREALTAEAIGVRVVCVRIGLVLARGGGALAKMLLPFRLGVGGRLGDGKQWMSWIHLEDLVSLMLHASRTDDLRGALNAVSPNPVTNRDFTRALGHALHRPTLFPVPKFALQLALGQTTEVVLASERVMPRVAERSGYRFQYTEIGAALRATL